MEHCPENDHRPVEPGAQSLIVRFNPAARGALPEV